MKTEVLELLQTIPKGRVTTYGRIASAVGHPRAARAVGTILHNNPSPAKYPCFRVVNAKGELTRNFAFGGIEAQKALLEADGIEVINYTVDLTKYLY